MANQAKQESSRATAQPAATRVRVKRVLFVCTGNTCRSPMAAALFRDAADKDPKPHIEIKSAGTDAWDGDSAMPLAIKVMKRRGIDLKSHRATRLTRDVIGWADLVLTMERSHKDRIVRGYPATPAKLYTIAEYAGEGRDIEAPLAKGTEKAYERCAQELTRLMPRILERLELLQRGDREIRNPGEELAGGETDVRRQQRIVLGQSPTVLPHDPGAERSVLGALLREGRPAVPGVTEELQPSDFYVDGHHHIYSAILAVFRRGEPVNSETVTGELQCADRLACIGDQAALDLLLKHASIPADLKASIRAVRDMGIRRELIQNFTDILRASETMPNVQVLLDDAIQRILRVRKRLEGETLSVGEILRDSVNDIE